jgi:AraC-like DNA-binding protein
MKNVEFFDWQLNLKRPLSWHVSRVGSDGAMPPADAHSALHLLIILEGRLTAQYVNDVLDFNAGDIFITAPWEVHRSINLHSRELLFVNIDPAALKSFFFSGYENVEKIFMLTPPERKKCLNCDHDFTEEKKQILQVFASGDSPQKTLQMWHAVLGLFLKIKVEKADYPEQNRALQQLQGALQNLSGKGLSVQEAARCCNLSSSYFASLFKKSFGLSFARYERMFRLNGAAGDIARGSSLKEAAADWGFCDKSHLARLLKARKKGL